MSLSDTLRRGRSNRPTDAGQRSASPALREPRVSLLPPELRAAEGARATKRRLIGGVVAVAVVVAAGITGSAGLAVTSQVGLILANSKTTELARQINRYAAVSQLQSRVSLTKAAVRVGSAPSVDWKAYLSRIDEVTPSAFTITGVAIDSASPVIDYEQGESPIDSQRVGTIALTASAASIDDLPAWLTGLSTLPGFADVSPNVSTGTDGGYTIIATLHITDGAYTTPLTKGVGN